MNITGLLNFKSPATDGEFKDADKVSFLIANSLKAVIEEFFIKMGTSLVIAYSCRRKSAFNFIRNILQILFSITTNLNVQLVNIDHKSSHRIDGLYNLLLVDSFEAFLDIDIISFNQNYTKNEFYHIFLLQPERYVQQDMMSIFNYCLNNEIPNCNIQYHNVNGELLLYTYFPFTSHECGSYEPHLINTFIGKSWANKTYFHQKLNNLYGCPLVVAVREVPPYLLIKQAPDGTLSFYGFEIEMVNLLAKKINFTLHLHPRFSNGRVIQYDSTVLKMVANRTADVALGFFHRRPGEDNQFSATFPYYQSQVVAVLYLPAHMLNTFEVLLYPFQDRVWYGLCLSIAIILVITGLMRRNSTQSLSIFSMTACALGAPIQHKPKLPHSILMFITWLWSSFIIRLIYSELLFQLLRYTIYSFKPKTLIEAIDNNFEAVMSHLMYEDLKNISLFNNSLDGKSIVLPAYDKFGALFYIEESNINNLFAVTYFDFFAYFMMRYNKPGLFYVIPETVLRQQLCFYMAKHSYLINQFDREILVLRASGLFKFLSRKHFDYNYFVKDQIYQDYYFKLEDLWSIYVVCCWFYLIALVVLLIEILSRKIKFFARLFN